MIIGTGKIYLFAPWVNSLKEKRIVLKSILEKTKNKFNVSIAEIENQDVHKSLVIGIACVSNEAKHASQMITSVFNFIENNTEAYVTDSLIEIL